VKGVFQWIKPPDRNPVMSLTMRNNRCYYADVLCTISHVFWNETDMQMHRQMNKQTDGQRNVLGWIVNN